MLYTRVNLFARVFVVLWYPIKMEKKVILSSFLRKWMCCHCFDSISCQNGCTSISGLQFSHGWLLYGTISWIFGNCGCCNTWRISKTCYFVAIFCGMSGIDWSNQILIVLLSLLFYIFCNFSGCRISGSA